MNRFSLMQQAFLVWLIPAGFSSVSAEVDFAKEVLPVLSDKCFVCHGPDAHAYGDDMRRLDSFEASTAATDSGRAIDPEAPHKSLVIHRIHSTDDPMPPEDAEKQLTAAERELLTRWINEGGNYAKHWAFVPPIKAEVQSENGSNVIDELIRRPIAARNLDFSAEAERSVLARRVALLLTGLPPERPVLDEYLRDQGDSAYSRLIEKLMASPRYGEHQARYWLDAVRYGDTHGLHLDNRRGIYPYRDWVVRAMNENMPLDQFITWQLAGDLLPESTVEQMIATGFVRMNPSTAEGGAIPAEFQAKNNFDRTETLGTVLLGMTLTCARCHTHKYDPIPQSEYYQLLAFFNSTAEHSMDGNKYEYGPTLKVPSDQSSWNQWQSLLKQRSQLIATAEAKSVKLNGDEAERLNALICSDRPLKHLDFQAKAEELLCELTALEHNFATTLVAQDLAKPRTTHVLHRGEYNQPVGEPVEPGVISVMGRFPEGAPRNRLGLAQWLTGREHPVVARVLVNRIWQRVFGYGLVRTPEDFGVQGQHPTHPELLDWLAVELHESGWDLQHMLRLMLNSRTFRQSSVWREDVEDPENRLYARASSYRLDAEVIRDVGLWSSGLLDSHMGGEGVKPYQPDGMWLAMAHPASNTKQYKRDTGSRLYRRSLYVYWKRTSPHPMMTLFDAPDRESSCVRRSRTNTSLQSLGLLNETQRIEMSRHLAERLLEQSKSDEERLKSLYIMLACRPPRETEQAACLALLNQMKERFNASDGAAESLVSTGESRPSDSLPAADLAAWTQVASTVLASDAAILLY